MIKPYWIRECRLFALAVVVAMGVFGCSKSPEPETSPFENLTQPKPKAPPPDCVEGAVAMVDDRAITYEDARKRAIMNLHQTGVSEEDPDFETKVRRAVRGAVDFLIQAYVLQAAATDTVEVTTAEIEERLISIKTKHPSREAYEAALVKAEMSEDELKRTIEDSIRIEKAMTEAANRNIPTPAPEEAREFYDLNTLLFGWPYRVRYDLILWPLAPEVSDASRQQATLEMEKLADRLRETPDLFNDILIESGSTTWGYLGLSPGFQMVEKLPEEIKDALEKLIVGETSNVIQTPNGPAVIRLRSTQESYESARNEILRSIFEERSQTRLEEWMDRERAKHRIRICDVDFYEGRIGAEETEDSENGKAPL